MRHSTILATGVLALALGPAVALAACDISGPADVSANQSFSLCAPSGNGYRYEWYGPGITANQRGRCVTVAGRSRGTYEYLLVVSVNGQEVDRCRSVVNVGGATGGVESCTINGPTTLESGGTAQLCATGAVLHSYSWEGPNGFSANTSCVTVSDPGTYILTTRNPITGSMRQCTHRIDYVGSSGTSGTSECAISGPDVIPFGQSVQLCGPARSNVSYQWRGPNGFLSSSRCIQTTRVGSYTLVIRNRSNGYTESCTQTLYQDNSGDDQGDDADNVVSGNCPRAVPFWRRQCASGARSFSTGEMRALAQRIDQESDYFNWGDDLSGFCQTISPTGPLTQRKRAAREYAALLANVLAGEYVSATSDGVQVSLDRDTEVNYQGTTTIGDLIVRADRMFVSGRGSFNRLYQVLHAVNGGQGIGPTCE